MTTPGEGTFSYTDMEVVELVAEAEDGYRFVEWTGDVRTIGDVNAANTTITMSDNYAITANFVKRYGLTISSTTGGSVITPGENTYTYDEGEVVNLVAESDEGYQFVNWTGNVGSIANADSASTTITMNGDYSVTANFAQEEAVYFADPNLEAAIREAIGKPAGPIYPSGLRRCAYLYASGKDIADLTGLEHASSLRQLGLPNNQINDISTVANLASLTWLDLGSNPISDISPLASLTSLTLLWLPSNQISDISHLASLTKLVNLDLSANLIDDIRPLFRLNRLGVLTLASNRVSDISTLANLASLSQLFLMGNQVADISPLAGLTNLIYLDLRHNQIDDVSPLANLMNLRTLYLGHNLIGDVSALTKLTRLAYLDLHGNQIGDISPLVSNLGLMELDVVDLRSNPLSAASIATYIPQLQARGVVVYH